MEKPTLPANEQERLAALYRYDILDTDFEESFDDLAKVASVLCDTPIALISLIDPNRQWFKAARGLDARETPRDSAFCAHAIHKDEVMIVHDTLEDSRFHDNPLVTGDPNIRFYAGAPIITNDGYPLGTICSIDRKPRELTKEQIEGLKALSRQVTINLEMRRQMRTLNEINQSKNRLFSIISHDMRSPLSTLNTVINHLFDQSDSLDEEEKDQWLHAIQKSAATSLTIAENLLKWARFEEGTVQYNPKTIDLEEFFSKIRPILEENAQSKNIELVTEIEATTATVADETMLHSIIQNTVSNSIKFTHENGTVKIACKAKNSGTHISISDTGVGMKEKTLENLFKIESTYSAEGTQGEKGSGLGLCLCKQFAEKMGGSLNVESKEGVGTTMHIHLPAKSF
ncbi:GAF domain-containing sensor histidine kinase [Puniceicoccaceae bacterium K14]|nr:GAF domain-containing sensor histidine kinase [Puniceicoccaceae bacterium K14]